MDDDNQVSDFSYSRFNGVTTYAFTLPCSSSDENDIPLRGTHHFLLAKGPLRDGDISYHRVREVVPDRVTIACGSKLHYSTMPYYVLSRQCIVFLF